LILGETGAGKNHLARVIAGHRRWLTLKEMPKECPDIKAGLEPFLDRFGDIMLTTLPENLIESLLFGYVKGAFTGATESKWGYLGGADSGERTDILLDEVGDASPALQSKLLGVLESRRFLRLGAKLDDEIETDARLLMATNRNLQQAVIDKQFREDLLWRARGMVVVVPPLREQPENIVTLAASLLEMLQEGQAFSLDPTPLTLSEADSQWARSYQWPGNVRELKLALTRWLAWDGTVSLEHVVRQVLNEIKEPTQAANKKGIVDYVGGRLDQACSGGTPVGSLDNLLGEVSRATRAAVLAWVAEHQPSQADLERIFPEVEVKSVVTKLAKWRAE
jgi:transcriptional regulator with GAF, ATPase, and Fis domain